MMISKEIRKSMGELKIKNFVFLTSVKMCIRDRDTVMSGPVVSINDQYKGVVKIEVDSLTPVSYTHLSWRQP